MRTGLTKKQKTTVIYFDEHSRIIEVQTHNTDLKKRLTAFAAKYPQCCRQTDAIRSAIPAFAESPSSGSFGFAPQPAVSRQSASVSTIIGSRFIKGFLLSGISSSFALRG